MTGINSIANQIWAVFVLEVPKFIFVLAGVGCEKKKTGGEKLF
jgi:hypothetical protein